MVIEYDPTFTSQCDTLGNKANNNFIVILTIISENAAKFDWLEMQLED